MSKGKIFTVAAIASAIAVAAYVALNLVEVYEDDCECGCCDENYIDEF